MNVKIIGFLFILCVVLCFVISFMHHKINTLQGQKNDLQIEVEKKDKAIQEMEFQNYVLREAEKENSKFKEQLAQDRSDNLDVVPEPYILERLHKD